MGRSPWLPSYSRFATAMPPDRPGRDKPAAQRPAIRFRLRNRCRNQSPTGLTAPEEENIQFAHPARCRGQGKLVPMGRGTCALTRTLLQERENQRPSPGETQRIGSANGLRIANPRYSRLPVGATRPALANVAPRNRKISSNGRGTSALIPALTRSFPLARPDGPLPPRQIP